jgi:hypothetical protein
MGSGGGAVVVVDGWVDVVEVERVVPRLAEVAVGVDEQAARINNSITPPRTAILRRIRTLPVC